MKKKPIVAMLRNTGGRLWSPNLCWKVADVPPSSTAGWPSARRRQQPKKAAADDRPGTAAGGRAITSQSVASLKIANALGTWCPVVDGFRSRVSRPVVIISTLFRRGPPLSPPSVTLRERRPYWTAKLWIVSKYFLGALSQHARYSSRSKGDRLFAGARHCQGPTWSEREAARL